MEIVARHYHQAYLPLNSLVSLEISSSFSLANSCHSSSASRKNGQRNFFIHAPCPPRPLGPDCEPPILWGVGIFWQSAGRGQSRRRYVLPGLGLLPHGGGLQG